jgi:hypothetical protein
MRRVIALGFCAMAMVLCTGCLDTGSVGQVTSADDVKVSLSKIDDEWSLGLGCYWTAEGYVYNSGSATAEGVQVSLNLIDAGTGAIKDSRTVEIGTLAPGASQAFSVKLDGECGNQYRVDVRLLAP